MVCLGLDFTIRTTPTLGVTCGVQKVVCSYPWAGVAHSRMWFRESVRLWDGIYLSETFLTAIVVWLSFYFCILLNDVSKETSNGKQHCIHIFNTKEERGVRPEM